ncbi:MAG: hypothetical protein ABEI86_10475, partial [Halobacteriaceae archaeon]
MKRRNFLRVFGVAGVTGLAGCDTGDNAAITSSETVTTKPTTATGTPQSTGTPDDNQAPQITAYRAIPKEYGTSLAVRMAGKDNIELSEAAVLYGNQRLQERSDGRTVTLQGKLHPDENRESPDQVAYLLRDAAGNKTRKE